jgi:hypothetical protein
MAEQRSISDEAWWNETTATGPLMNDGDDTEVNWLADYVEAPVNGDTEIHSYEDFEMSVAHGLGDAMNIVDDKVVSRVEDGKDDMPIHDNEMRTWEDELLHPLPMQLEKHGALTQAKLGSITSEVRAFQCAMRLSKDQMKTVIATTEYPELSNDPYNRLLSVLPNRKLSRRHHLMQLVSRRFLPKSKKICIQMDVKVSILLHHRELVVSCKWESLRKAMGNNLALPHNIRENCAGVDAASWLRHRFLGLYFIDMRRCGTSHTHDWLLGEIMELELLWQEEFRKFLMRELNNQSSLKILGPTYHTTPRTWDIIGLLHSSRTTSQCKAFWDVEYGF